MNNLFYMATSHPEDTFTPVPLTVIIEEDEDSPWSPEDGYQAGLLTEAERDRLTDYQNWGLV